MARGEWWFYLKLGARTLKRISKNNNCEGRWQEESGGQTIDSWAVQ